MGKIAPRKIRTTKREYLPEQYFRNGDWHWSYNVLLFGLFAGLFSVNLVGNKTLVFWDDLFKGYLLIAFVPLLLPYKYYRNWLKMERIEVILLFVLGLGPLILSILLWVNYLIPVQRESLKVEVVRIESLGTGISPGDIEFLLEDDTFEQFPRVRIYDYLEEGEDIVEARSITFQKSTGLLGYDVISNVEFNIE